MKKFAKCMSLLLTALLLFTMISCAEPDTAENLPPQETILSDLKVAIVNDITDGLNENDLIELKLTQNNVDLTAEEFAKYDIYYTTDGFTEPTDKDEMKYDPTAKISMTKSNLILKAKAYLKENHNKVSTISNFVIPVHENVVKAYVGDKEVTGTPTIELGAEYKFTLTSDKPEDKIEWSFDNKTFTESKEVVIPVQNYEGTKLPNVTVTTKVNGVESSTFTFERAWFDVELSNKVVPNDNGTYDTNVEIKFYTPTSGVDFKKIDVYYTVDGKTNPTNDPAMKYDFNKPEKMPSHDITIKFIGYFRFDPNQHTELKEITLKAAAPDKTKKYLAYIDGRELVQGTTKVLEFNKEAKIDLSIPNAETKLQYSWDNAAYTDYDANTGIVIPAEKPVTEAITKTLYIKENVADSTPTEYNLEWHAYSIDFSNQMNKNPEADDSIIFWIFEKTSATATKSIPGNEMKNWTIRYTLDGSNPDTNSTVYDYLNPPKVPNSKKTTVKAIAYDASDDTAHTGIFSQDIILPDPVAKAYISIMDGDNEVEKELGEFTALTANEELVVTLKAPASKTIQYSLNDAEFVNYTGPIKIVTDNTELISLRTKLVELGESSILEYSFKVPAEIAVADNKIFITQVMNAGYSAKFIILTNVGDTPVILSDYLIKFADTSTNPDYESTIALRGTLKANEQAIIFARGTHNGFDTFLDSCTCPIKIEDSDKAFEKWSPKYDKYIELHCVANNDLLDKINHTKGGKSDHISYVRVYAEPITIDTGAYRFNAKHFTNSDDKLTIIEYNENNKTKLNSLLKEANQIK